LHLDGLVLGDIAEAGLYRPDRAISGHFAYRLPIPVGKVVSGWPCCLDDYANGMPNRKT